MKNVTVSVLVATNNRPEMLKDALQSVFDQSFQDFEIIVVDDGQKISAESVVSEFVDERIRYIRHTEQKGCAGSRVTGIAAARSNLVAFLDDDDIWEKDKLKIQVEKLVQTPQDVGFSFTAATLCFNERVTVTEVPDGVANYYERALSDFSGFLSVTLMFKKEVFETVGTPDPAFPSHTDIEFIIRVTQKFKGLGINKTLTKVNMEEGRERMSTNFSRRIIGREMLLNKHKSEFEKRPKVLAEHLFKLAWFYRSDGRYKEARRVYVQVLRLDFTLKKLLRYVSMIGNGFGYKLYVKIKHG